MPRTIATNTTVDLNELLDFVRPRHQMILATRRRDGSPQLSPVTGGVDPDGRIVISSYPERAKLHNLRRDPAASVLVLSDDFGGAWVQVDGPAEVLDMPSPEAEDGLVEYFRCISGEHPDWDEYRQAMRDQGKSLIRVTPSAGARSPPAASPPASPDRAGSALGGTSIGHHDRSPDDADAQVSDQSTGSAPWACERGVGPAERAASRRTRGRPTSGTGGRTRSAGWRRAAARAICASRPQRIATSGVPRGDQRPDRLVGDRLPALAAVRRGRARRDRQAPVQQQHAVLAPRASGRRRTGSAARDRCSSL